jgi:PKD repeat protein
MPFGTTRSSAQRCDCNVSADIDVLDRTSNNVTIDISGSVYPDRYYLQIGEADAQGNYLQGSNTWVGGWFNTLPNQINLSGQNNPLGAYNFQPGHFYRIGLAVKGHCTGWTGLTEVIQVEGAGEPEFEVATRSCDDVSIDVSATTGALRYRFSAVEVDAQENPVAGTAASSAWINTLTNPTVSLSSSTGPLNYDFTGGNEYRISLEIETICGIETKERIVEIASTAIPSFTLEPSCNSVILDGRASQNETSFEIFATRVNQHGNPMGSTVSLTLGPVMGEMTTTPDLMRDISFAPGAYYRITLSVSNDCSSNQTTSQVFQHTITPDPNIEGGRYNCEGDDYYIDISNSYGLDEMNIVVYESDQTGTIIPGAPTIAYTNGWVPFQGQNPTLRISPSNQITFLPDRSYTVKIFGRNGCSGVEESDFKVVDVKSQADCNYDEEVDEYCTADFDIVPTFSRSAKGVAVQFLDKSIADLPTMIRAWSFGNGKIDYGRSSPQHVFQKGGNYNVSLLIRDGFGCMDSITKQVQIPSISKSGFISKAKRNGLEDQAHSTIVPNPSTRRFKLSYSIDMPGTFTLLDITGKAVLKASLDVDSDELHVNVSDLPAGVYFGRVSVGGSQVKTHKVMIRK